MQERAGCLRAGSVPRGIAIVPSSVVRGGSCRSGERQLAGRPLTRTGAKQGRAACEPSSSVRGNMNLFFVSGSVGHTRSVPDTPNLVSEMGVDPSLLPTTLRRRRPGCHLRGVPPPPAPRATVRGRPATFHAPSECTPCRFAASNRASAAAGPGFEVVPACPTPARRGPARCAGSPDTRRDFVR